jgi:hypothetical protein
LGSPNQLQGPPEFQAPSKLDPFKGQIIARLESHPYSAQKILQHLKTQGHAGGYSILKEFIHLVRPVRKHLSWPTKSLASLMGENSTAHAQPASR